MQLQVTVAMYCDRQSHASNVPAYLTKPTVIVCTMSLDGYHTYTSLFVLLSLTMHRHRPSNCTIILPVLEGCGPLAVAMLTAVAGIVGVPVLPSVVGVVGVALLATVAGATHRKEGMNEETECICALLYYLQGVPLHILSSHVMHGAEHR